MHVHAALAFPYELTFGNFFFCEEAKAKLGLSKAVFNLESSSILWILFMHGYASRFTVCALSSFDFEVAQVRAELLAYLQEPVRVDVMAVVFENLLAFLYVTKCITAELISFPRPSDLAVWIL